MGPRGGVGGGLSVRLGHSVGWSGPVGGGRGRGLFVTSESLCIWLIFKWWRDTLQGASNKWHSSHLNANMKLHVISSTKHLHMNEMLGILGGPGCLASL